MKAATIFVGLQTIAIVAGVGIAVYELYFNDRALQRQETLELDRRSFEIASRLFKNEEMTSFIEMATQYNDIKVVQRYRDGNPAERKQVQNRILVGGYPILLRIAEIDSCLSRDLCRPKIVLGMVCPPIVGIDREFKDLSNMYRGVSQLKREKPLQRMIDRCATFDD